MSFSGLTYGVPCNRGGFNNNSNIDIIPPESFVYPSRNINLHKGGRGKRGGTSKVESTAVTGAPRIMGMFDYVLTSSQFQVFGADDGNVYKDTTTTIKTGMSTANKFHFETMRDVLYIADGSSVPQTWDGAALATSNLTAVAADWSGSAHPSVMIKHRRGLSERLYAFGVAGYRQKLYYSKNGTGGDFSGSGDAGSLRVPTRDAYGIVGAVEFGNRLIVMGKTESFIVGDSSSDIAAWGVERAQWDAGVAHQRLIVKTPNDVVCMTEDGEIYSISAVQSYGDYKQASLARPAFIDVWIRENINLSYIDDFHAVYDPELRAIKFFMVRSGESTIDTALVYFIDKPAEEAWVIHDNQTSASGYDASASCAVKSGTTYKVYTGDYSGFLWKLEQNNKNDDSNGYYAGFKTPNLTFDNPRQTKIYRNIRLITQSGGLYALTINWWVDGVSQDPMSILLSGTGSVYGTGLFGTATYGQTDILDQPDTMGEIGKRIQVEIYNSNANEDFFVSQVVFDFKPLGVRP